MISLKMLKSIKNVALYAPNIERKLPFEGRYGLDRQVTGLVYGGVQSLSG